MNHDEVRLKEILDSWNLEFNLPSDFNSQVWNRISVKEESILQNWLNRLQGFFNKDLMPQQALTLFSMVLLVSILGGTVQSRLISESHSARMEKSYLASIDPYSKALEIASR